MDDYRKTSVTLADEFEPQIMPHTHRYCHTHSGRVFGGIIYRKTSVLSVDESESQMMLHTRTDTHTHRHTHTDTYTHDATDTDRHTHRYNLLHVLYNMRDAWYMLTHELFTQL